MTNNSTPVDRTRRVLDQARYMSLATVSAEGRPWVATLEYAWLADPLRFVFGSATGSRHGRDLVLSPAVSGALFVAGGSPGLDVAAVDGAQFSGVCAEIPAAELDRYYAAFYEAVLPDAEQRTQWSLPPSLLQPPAPHRLYLVEVEQWWLIDTSAWEQDRIDRRLEVPLTELSAGTLDGGRSWPSEAPTAVVPTQGDDRRTPTGQGR